MIRLASATSAKGPSVCPFTERCQSTCGTGGGAGAAAEAGGFGGEAPNGLDDSASGLDATPDAWDKAAAAPAAGLGATPAPKGLGATASAEGLDAAAASGAAAAPRAGRGATGPPGDLGAASATGSSSGVADDSWTVMTFPQALQRILRTFCLTLSSAME